MSKTIFHFLFCILILSTSSCSSTQSRFVFFDKNFPPKAQDHEVKIFFENLPEIPYIEISRLDVHIEKTFFSPVNLENALPELKKQAILSGADAIIKIIEKKSKIVEARSLHVTATGIKFVDKP